MQNILWDVKKTENWRGFGVWDKTFLKQLAVRVAMHLLRALEIFEEEEMHRRRRSARYTRPRCAQLLPRRD